MLQCSEAGVRRRTAVPLRSGSSDGFVDGSIPWDPEALFRSEGAFLVEEGFQRDGHDEAHHRDAGRADGLGGGGAFSPFDHPRDSCPSKVFVTLEGGLRVGPVTEAPGQLDGALDGQRGALAGTGRGSVNGVADEGHPPSGPAGDGRQALERPDERHGSGIGRGEDLFGWCLPGEDVS